MSLNLIDQALQYARQARINEQSGEKAINEPLSPDARKNMLYIRVRESCNKGCRKAVKLIPQNWKRSIAFSVLMRATYDIFHYGYDQKIINLYNTELDSLIGTH